MMDWKSMAFGWHPIPHLRWNSSDLCVSTVKPGYGGWKNHLEKWWSSSVGIMTFPYIYNYIYIMENNKNVWNHQPVLVACNTNTTSSPVTTNGTGVEIPTSGTGWVTSPACLQCWQLVVKKMIQWYQWPFQDPKLEVPTIYKAYFSGLNFREYPHNIWPYLVQYLHFRILEFPLMIGNIGDLY